MKNSYKRLGNYVREVNIRNTKLTVTKLLGVSIQKVLIPSIANTVGTDMSTYKILKKGQFAYGPVTSRNGDKISIALLKDYEEVIVSQAYTCFEIINNEDLLPEYLMMWFQRPEFDRYARFKSHGSAREVFDWAEMCNIELPIPSIETQREIVAEYNALQKRIELNNRLIQKLEETAQAIYRQWFVEFEFPNEEGKPYKSSGGEMIESELGPIPKGWNIEELVNVCNIITAGVIPNYTSESNHFVLGQRCIHDNEVDLTFARMHTFKENCLLTKFGDILINSTGSGTLGRVGQIYFEPINLAFDSNMTLVRASKDEYIEYLGCLLSNKEALFAQISQGSTNQTRLYCSMIRPLLIMNPEYSVLSSFRHFVRTIRFYIQKQKREKTLLSETKSLLLSRMITIKK